MAEVALEGVSKAFSGTVHAVKDFSLSIAHGEFAVLLGPSGCGKTTCLRLIAGLERADRGNVKIGGRIVNDVPPQKRDVAVVFQSYALYPHMTVAQNMAFGLKMHGVPSSEIQTQVQESSRMLGLDDLLGRYPSQLSGGQRQRVALGRAIVRHPAVFLLDEPLSNLDAQLRAEMRVELLKLQHRLEGTFVFVTHDQVEAMTMASTIGVMRNGVLQQKGTPRQIYERPANMFVAGFIGSPKMNFIPGTLTVRGTEIVVDTAAFAGSLPARLPGARSHGSDGRVILGIRPEHVTVIGATSGPGSVEMTVEVVEMLGGQQFVYGTIAINQVLWVSVDPKHRVAVGDRIRLYLPPEAMHFFDPASGDRLDA